jgi:diguanylate cyclase (GGDEF)-like protein
MDPLELADASERERLAGYLAAHAAGAAHTQTTFRGLRRDGADLFVECHGQAVTVEGKVLLMGLVMDVTDRVRAEREVQRLQAQLLEQSTHDPLTGLYNRRFMGEALERALADARQHQQEVSVIMCDVDHFKAINDRVGHLGGDEVLCAVGRVLEASGRRDDVCCRYGGEEFLLVLPTMTVADAHARAEEIRRAVESQLIPFAGSRLAVTASFGVAGFPIAGRSIDEVLIAADRALYAAKRLGRNRVAVAPPAAPRNLPASAHPAHC